MLEKKQDKLKEIIQKEIGKRILNFSLKRKGMCNNAWYLETEDNSKYLVKQERHNKETKEENDLLVEAKIIEKLNKKNPSLKIPKIIFICENPKMYCYEYVSGELMKEGWAKLSGKEKISLCRELGKFHAKLHKTFSINEIKELGLVINKSIEIGKEYEDRVNNFLKDKNTPQKYRNIITRMKQEFLHITDEPIFGLCHYDSHDENIIINNGKLACVIDFGDTGYGDICLDFNYHVQNYPNYFEFILKEYEKLSGNKVSRKRLMAQTIFHAIRGINDNNLETKKRVYANYMNWLEDLTSKLKI